MHLSYGQPAPGLRLIGRRALRFLIAGVASTAVAYGVLMLLLGVGLHYSLAVAGSWPCATLTSFTLNRRFTFGIVHTERRSRDLGLFAVGSFLQLGLAIVGFGFFLSFLGPSLAFLANLVSTTVFSFGFHSLVTFRRRPTGALGGRGGVEIQAHGDATSRLTTLADLDDGAIQAEGCVTGRHFIATSRRFGKRAPKTPVR